MKRRSFFGFFPAAVVGVVVGVPVVRDSSFWRSVQLYAEKVSPWPRSFKMKRMTPERRAEFKRVFIDPILNMTPAELAEEQARQIDCVGRYCLGLPQKVVS